MASHKRVLRSVAKRTIPATRDKTSARSVATTPHPSLLLSTQDVLRLQRVIGNRAIEQLLRVPSPASPEAGPKILQRAKRTGKGGTKTSGVSGKPIGIKKKKKAPAPRRSQRVRYIPLSQVRDQGFYQQYGAMTNTGVNGEAFGSDVEHVVGPRSGSYLGSGPNQSIMSQTIGQLNVQLPTSNNWIRGHLLNDWIGGSGNDNENLAPMSHTTNQQWNRNFEQRLKAITEVIYSFYNNPNTCRYFLVVGYRATATGTYAPANAQGITIPQQFDGNWYYGAYDRLSGTVDYGNTATTAAFAELNTATRNQIAQIEGMIVQTTMQTH